MVEVQRSVAAELDRIAPVIDELGRRFTEAVRLARQAPSLGGPETLITHPASTTHVGLTPEEMASTGIGPGTMRVSCGLEHPDDVIADFDQALRAIGR